MLKKLLTFFRRNHQAPPPLATDHDLAAYREFMCAETHLYNETYIRERVQISGLEHFHEALAKGPVIVVFVHHGSWLLMNGALHHFGGSVPITSIASRRNLEFCSAQEREFWLGVHQRAASSCNAPVIFYTDQSSFGPVRWLRQPGHVLTVALDVREPAADRQEYPFHFMGRTIYLQNGPARLARLTGACLVPAAIEYDPAARRHQLFLYPMLDPQQLDPQALTQKALDCIGPHVQRRPAQQFYDLLAALEQPQQTA